MKDKKKLFLLLVCYFAALISANLIVKYFGAKGLWFTAFFLIPFDFVVRCFFHEKWRGYVLVRNITVMTFFANILTFVIYYDAKMIALASFCGFTAAQIGAGVFYQNNIDRSWFRKVNISDIIAIVCDSIVFQLIAFEEFDWKITIGQAVVKFCGGLLWYYILFVKFKIQK